jgi:hypothetical protein
MTIQTSFSVDHVIAFPGQPADLTHSTVISKINTYSAAIPFGSFVCRAAAGVDESCALPVASADVTARPRGVAIKDQTHRGSNNLDNEVNDMVPIMTKGRVWVTVEGAVTEGSAAFVRFASGAGGSILGLFRADADSATAVAIPNGAGIFRTSTTGAGLALLELNLP